MMESKHTPGPWHWVNGRTDEPYNFADAEGYPSLRTVKESGEHQLSEWILDAEPMMHGNDEANAYLIAAAPDLLEACKMLLASAHDYQSGIAEAETAIAKAKGRS